MVEFMFVAYEGKLILHFEADFLSREVSYLATSGSGPRYLLSSEESQMCG